ncbi:hypothetical protein CALVIDRAFT_562178 [Calocera viscosa TUFC12733]|uniref:Uncharacterized protein n=1 Tax=Calocera viscosa (strain TUFC12733) TaxID=1330018 RepID=A0A167NZJ5_CALVF|nr:hypothetical protein CALVIDRAFT_562178 [Calocera viscosa TUFC12733]
MSISYGCEEIMHILFYKQRRCNETMKLGLHPVILLFSIDASVASCYGIGSTDRQYHAIRFVPFFPATYPYVTSVGAMQIPEGDPVFAAEVAITAKVFSSGGLSDVFLLPDYQADAVQHHYKKYAAAAVSFDLPTRRIRYDIFCTRATRSTVRLLSSHNIHPS